MAIVSCPECQKKLKIADTSIGKKVKCSCGTVFVAQAEAAAAPKPAMAAVAIDKVVVACTECGAKLKVGTGSLGKKMKCPKCASVFVAATEEPAAPPPPPAKKAPPKPVEEDDDDLMAFAQSDLDSAPSKKSDDDNLFDDDEEEAPKPKGKLAKKPVSDDFEDEDDIPMPKGKPGKKVEADDEEEEEEEDTPWGKPGKAAAKPAGDDSAKPVYPSRLLVNILVGVMMFVFIGLFVAIFFDFFHADTLGLEKPKTPQAKLQKRPPIVNGKENDKDKDKNKLANGEIDKDKQKNKWKLQDDPATRQENKIAATKLNGAWVVESLEDGGVSIDAAKGKKFVFADGIITAPDTAMTSFTVNAKMDPAWIDIVKGDKTIFGVYFLEGDTLMLCYADKGKRPTKFDSNEGELFTLTRDTKKKEPVKKIVESPQAKMAAAKAQIAALTMAVEAYALKNDSEYPKTLNDLVTGKPQYVKDKNALLDPWNKPYQYDPSGLKNDGLKPDIWTVTPTKEVIGNWPTAKVNDPDKEKPKEKDKAKDPPQGKSSERQKQETAWLAEYRKMPPEKAPGAIAVIGPHEPAILYFAFASSAPLVATVAKADKDAVKIWDLATLKAIKTIPAAVPSQSALVALSPDGAMLAVATYKDKFGKGLEVKVWMVEGASEVKTIPVAAKGLFSKGLTGLKFTSDGKRLTLVMFDQANGVEATTWDVADGMEHKLAVNAKFGHAFLSQSGDVLYECTNFGDKAITIRDLKTDMTRTVKMKNPLKFQDRVTPDGKFYVEAEGGPFFDRLQFIDLETGNVDKIATDSKITGIQFTPDGKYVLYTVNNTTAKLIDIATKKTVWTGPSTLMYTFTPGGVFFARVNQSSIQLLAVEDMIAGKK